MLQGWWEHLGVLSQSAFAWLRRISMEWGWSMVEREWAVKSGRLRFKSYPYNTARTFWVPISSSGKYTSPYYLIVLLWRFRKRGIWYTQHRMNSPINGGYCYNICCIAWLQGLPITSVHVDGTPSVAVHGHHGCMCQTWADSASNNFQVTSMYGLHDCKMDGIALNMTFPFLERSEGLSR